MSDQRDDVLLTVGRELLQALRGNAYLDLAEHEYLLEDETEDWIVLVTNHRTLRSSVMGALGERGYELEFLGKVTEQDYTDISRRRGYAWRINVPDETLEQFAAYVETRGEAHPAPPKDYRYRSVYNDAEPLPHPVVDRAGFEEKIAEVASE